MNDLNESTHERLNRELARMRMRDVGLWGGWALLVGVLGLVGFVSLNTITEARYVVGIAGGTIPLTSEDGTTIVTRVTVEGRIRDIRLPSQLVHPAVGDPVCLRAGEHRFTGHTSYVPVSRTLCEGTETTEGVD